MKILFIIYIGIIAGHLYYHLEDVYPAHTGLHLFIILKPNQQQQLNEKNILYLLGRQPLKTPGWLKALCGESK